MIGRRDRIAFGDFALDGDRNAVWVVVDENAEWLFVDKGDSQIMMSISCAEHVVELLRQALEAARRVADRNAITPLAAR